LTLVANKFDTSTASIVDTGVNDTDGKFAASINNTSGKFDARVNYSSGKNT
jgi:hypothetical protein